MVCVVGTVRYRVSTLHGTEGRKEASKERLKERRKLHRGLRSGEGKGERKRPLVAADALVLEGNTARWHGVQGEGGIYALEDIVVVEEETDGWV